MAREKRSQIVRDLSAAIGRRVSTRRNELGMRKAELERRSGLVRRVLNGVEAGARDPDVATLLALADALDVEVPYFFDDLAVVPPTAPLDRPSPERVAETEALVEVFSRIPNEDHRRQLIALLKACVKSGHY